MKHFYFTLIFLSLSFFINAQSTTPTGNSTEVGVTEGQLSVSLRGGANYNIPIVVPSGINGVEPKISLSYNSQGGNGMVGYGWNISGVSSITRIPSTKFHDGIVDPVDFDALDRFALDGQRLIIKNGTGGIYGANGTVYETENFSNVKITSYGVHSSGANYGPAYFLVEYPDGSKAYYGNSVDSQSMTDWSITYWENPQGIRINYGYTWSNNILNIFSIKYGSRFNDTPINEIQFLYKLRLRHEQSYIGGESFLRNTILSDVKIIGNGIGFKNYSLMHDATSLNYERLISVTEKNGDNSKSYNPTIFEYENTEDSITLSPQSTILSINPTPIVPSGYIIPEGLYYSGYNVGLSGDFEPNGKSGLIRYSTSPGQKNHYIFHSDVGSSVSLSTGTRIFTGGMFDELFIVNCLSGDGVSGYKMMQNQAWCIAKTNYATDVTTFSIYSKNSIDPNPAKIEYAIDYIFPRYSHYNSQIPYSRSYTTNKKYLVGDFNGDNITDVIVIEVGINGRYDYFDKDVLPFRTSNPNDLRIEPGYDPSGGRAYFVNLDKRLGTNQVNFAGILEGQLNYNMFGTLQSVVSSGDADGDGRTDIIVNRGNVIDVYSLDGNNNLIKIQTTTFPKVGTSDPTNLPLSLGDYNGDGKVDFGPDFLSTGTSFSKVSYAGLFFGQTLRDFNNDGKTDGFSMTMTGKHSYALKFSSSVNTNNLAYTNISYATDMPSSGNSMLGLSILESTSLKKKNEIGIFRGGNDIEYLTMNKDFSKEKLLKSITVGNGTKDIITYSSLNSDEGVYTAAGALENYPYQDIANAPSFKIVSKLERQSASVYKKQLFLYYGAVSNIDGIGFLGFRSTVRTNWHDDSSIIISSISKFDIELRGANTENYTVFGLHKPLITPKNQIPRNIVKEDNYTVVDSDNLVATQQIILRANTWIKSGSTFSARINPEANISINTPTDYIKKTTLAYESELFPNKVFKLKNTKSKQFNTLDNTNDETTTEFDAFNNPLKTTTVVKEGETTVQTSIGSVIYKTPTASPYIVGRPESKIKSVSVTGDVATSEEVYEYNSNQLLSKIKKKGDTSTNYINEDNLYDAFGNIIKKTITAGADSRTTDFEYDPSGRFLKKSINVERLSTLYDYYPNGTLKSETNPYGLMTSYEYDSWFKKTKITDYLLKSKNYSYTRNAEKTIVKITGDDGSASEEILDDLGRKIRLGVKNINDVFSYVSYEYDIYDRNYKTSEPYFGANPSQWNQAQYDIYGRIIRSNSFANKVTTISYSGLSTTVTEGSKSKTSVKNAIGNVISLTDNPGGTINYTYFANGNLKESDYGGIKTTFTQDGWGRKKTLLDPSAGLFKYGYNDFNEIVSEETPNGTTTYKLNSVGRLIQKTIVGNNTNAITDYNYDTTKLLSSSVFKDLNEGGNSITNVFIYDASKKVIKYTETTPYAIFTKDYSYDTFGRVDKETSTATIAGKISAKAIKNTYKNGAHWQILDDATTQVLWQTNTINARGQLLTASVSNGNIAIINAYDNYGFATQVKQDRVVSNPGNIITLNTVFDAQKGNLTSRTNGLFGWNESFKYDGLDRLTDYTNAQGQQENQLYDEKGRITQNNLGLYDYNKAKPYQNASISLSLDAETYYTAKPKQIISYNTFKSPVQIEEVGVDKINFTYNDGNMRSTMFYGGLQDDKLLRQFRKHYSADGTMEISQNIITGTVDFVTYIGGDGYSASLAVKSDGVTQNCLYLQRDYLGTIIAISDQVGYVQEKRLFDAWGSIAKVQDGAGNTLAGLTILDRGYTGHEHIQSVGLINMNGRLYDNKLHRFLQPDNNIQEPFNTQNYNRYGYVLNNPLKYNDPSGESILEFIAGFIFSTYVHGAAASGGEVNPFKWDSNAWINGFSSAASSLGSYGLTASTNNYIDNYSNKPELGTNTVYSEGNNGNGTGHEYVASGDIHMPTQHNSLGFNWTYLSEGKVGERFIYDVGNTINIGGQFLMGRGVGDGSMRNLDGSSTSTDEGVMAFTDIAMTALGIKEAKMALSEARAAQVTLSSRNTIYVTSDGIALPKGARIPNDYIQNPFRSGDYGEMTNGSFKSRVRIDKGTPAGTKGPKQSHFHLDNGKEHIFDLNRWPWWY